MKMVMESQPRPGRGHYGPKAKPRKAKPETGNRMLRLVMILLNIAYLGYHAHMYPPS